MDTNLTAMQDMSRRSFIKASAAGLLGLPYASNIYQPDKRRGTIALQLYTVRNEIEKDLIGTLMKVSEIGFKYVETAFWPENVSLDEAAGALKQAGLKVCAVHCELPLGEEKRIMLKQAEVYQCDTFIWHGWPEDPRYSSVSGIEALATTYNQCMAFASQYNLRFGLHNHWWEFKNSVEGKYPYQILRPLLDERIFFELDTYWIKVAGLDPSAVVKEFANGAPLLHIKDGPARYSDSLGQDDPEPMTAVGKGTQDFPGIVAAAAGNTHWMIVEMDKTKIDVFQALEESFRYLIDNKLADSS